MFRSVLLQFWLINKIILLVLSEPNVTRITDPVGHADFPTWDTRNKILYFIDTVNGDLYRYNHNKSACTTIHYGGNLCAVVQSKASENLLVFGYNNSIGAINWDGESSPSPIKKLASLTGLTSNAQVGCTSGKADKHGRLWIQTTGDHKTMKGGALYQITRDNLESPKVAVAPVDDLVGIAWTIANNRLFHSGGSQIVEYNYNATTGDIKFKAVVFDLRNQKSDEVKGSLGGMAIDHEKKLWLAVYGGGCVIRVDPIVQTIMQIVKIPATYVTSVMWGGEYLDVLYVTTSKKEVKKKEPFAGCLFSISDLGASGLPAFEVDLLDSISSTFSSSSSRFEVDFFDSISSTFASSSSWFKPSLVVVFCLFLFGASVFSNFV